MRLFFARTASCTALHGRVRDKYCNKILDDCGMKIFFLQDPCSSIDITLTNMIPFLSTHFKCFLLVQIQLNLASNPGMLKEISG